MSTPGKLARATSVNTPGGGGGHGHGHRTTRPSGPPGSAKSEEKAADKFEEAQFLRKLVHLRDSQEAIQVRKKKEHWTTHIKG